MQISFFSRICSRIMPYFFIYYHTTFTYPTNAVQTNLKESIQKKKRHAKKFHSLYSTYGLVVEEAEGIFLFQASRGKQKEGDT